MAEEGKGTPPPKVGLLSRSALTSLSAGAIGLLGGLLLSMQPWKNTVIIDPIEVSNDISTVGYTREVLAAKLKDQIETIVQDSTTQMPAPQFRQDLANLVPDIEIPQTKLTLRQLLQALELTTPHISGEVIHDGPNLRLTVRFPSVKS